MTIKALKEQIEEYERTLNQQARDLWQEESQENQQGEQENDTKKEEELEDEQKEQVSSDHAEDKRSALPLVIVLSHCIYMYFSNIIIIHLI